MIRTPIHAAIAAALLGTLALAGCKKDEPVAVTPPPAAPAPAPMPPPVAAPTVSVTSVDLGNAIDANKRVTTPATTFAASDTIHASVATTSSDPSTPQRGQLTARWTFEDGQLVDEVSSAFDFTGTGNTAFQVSKPDGWPLGRYKVEIMLNGDVVQTREYEVR
jgi:hypothetical protein